MQFNFSKCLVIQFSKCSVEWSAKIRSCDFPHELVPLDGLPVIFNGKCGTFKFKVPDWKSYRSFMQPEDENQLCLVEAHSTVASHSKSTQNPVIP